MRSDFATRAKSARDLIPAPELPMESIRRRSRTASTRGRIRAFMLCSVICLTLVGVGVGFGAKLYDGVRVWLSGGKAAVVVRSFVMVREPTARDLHDVIARATFPIVFPVHLPTGTRMTMLIFAPADRPNFVEVDYRNERANFNVGFSLVDSATITTNEATLPTGTWRPPSYQWRIGQEAVLVPKFAHASLNEVNRIKADMMKTSPASSLVFTDKTLRRVVVLGVRPELADIAEHYAPPRGRSVLLDTELTRRIPSLVKRGKPVVDDRTIYLTNIPSVNGEPDYSKATLHWPKVILIGVPGVRAVDAVLRFTGAPLDCRCVILFNQPRSTTYWIWKIPLSSPTTITKYAVDAKTFTVTRST